MSRRMTWKRQGERQRKLVGYVAGRRKAAKGSHFSSLRKPCNG